MDAIPCVVFCVFLFSPMLLCDGDQILSSLLDDWFWRESFKKSKAFPGPSNHVHD
jgi:hypothetical protein